MRKEFRGLIIADYQKAIGQKAQDAIEDLNVTSIKYL